MRLIDGDKLLEKLQRMIDYCKKDKQVNGLTALFQVGDAIMDCKTIDAVPVVHGKWEQNNIYDEESNTYVCSVCDEPWTLNAGNPKCNNMHYCPNCGAKMDLRA